MALFWSLNSLSICVWLEFAHVTKLKDDGLFHSGSMTKILR